MDVPVDADAIIAQSTQSLVRLLFTEAGKKAVGWLASLWRRKDADEADQVAESVELDRKQLVAVDGQAREVLSDALQRKWADNLRRLLRDDPEALPELAELAQRLRAQDSSPAVSAPNQVGVNTGSGSFFQAGTSQTFHQGQSKQ